MRKKTVTIVAVLLLAVVLVWGISATPMQTVSVNVTLDFEAWDVELVGELEVYVNDVLIDSLGDPEWDDAWESFHYDITAQCTPTDNYVKFHNPLPYGASNIKEVVITADGVEVASWTSGARIVEGNPDPALARDAVYGPFDVEPEAEAPPSEGDGKDIVDEAPTTQPLTPLQMLQAFINWIIQAILAFFGR